MASDGKDESGRYIPEVKAIAWSLMCSGLSTSIIAERFNEGSAGLDYEVPVSEGTVKDWGRKWRQERGDPLTFGSADRAADSMRIIREQLLSALKVQANLFTTAASAGKLLSPLQVKTGAEIGRTLDDLERRADERAGRSTRSQQQHALEGRHDKPRAGGLLDQLVAAQAEETKKEAEDHE
jgi:transposase